MGYFSHINPDLDFKQVDALNIETLVMIRDCCFLLLKQRYLDQKTVEEGGYYYMGLELEGNFLEKLVDKFGEIIKRRLSEGTNLGKFRDNQLFNSLLENINQPFGQQPFDLNSVDNEIAEKILIEIVLDFDANIIHPLHRGL